MICDDQHVTVQAFQHIADIGADEWNLLSGTRPFQSHRWYQYGEQVMSDCKPTYLLAYKNEMLVARASFWLVRNEPMPKMNFLARKALTILFKYFPLLICKSPLAFTGGVIFPDENYQKLAATLSSHALSVAKKKRASFILFDYMDKVTAQKFSPAFIVSAAGNQGAIMENKWNSLDDYLASGNKKDRQHYKRTVREAEKLGIKIARHDHPQRVDDALSLIRRVEQTHGALPNPWALAMLENFEMVNGIFLSATINEKLVGCGLLLEDNQTQMTSLLGLEENVPYVYFMLAYESLKIAFEHQVRLLRWGSGAYDVKQRLGFAFEDNDSMAGAAVNPTLQTLMRRFN